MNKALARIPRSRRAEVSDELTAAAYPARVPDGEYFALCTHTFRGHSRKYGERVYVDFQLCDCADEGKTIRMYLRPSKWPTSNFYLSWAIARGGPPRSRNTKMSERVFNGKVFRVRTTTVKRKHSIMGIDGKSRPGPDLPESFWYSKIQCILSLEATNENVLSMPTINTTEAGGLRPPEPPVCVTNFPSNPFSESALSEGEVGSGELGVGRNRESGLAVRDGTTNATPHHQPVEGPSLPAPSPREGITLESHAHDKLERDKGILRAKGFLP